LYRRRRKKRRLRCSHQHDQYKSLNLTEEDWLEDYTLWSLSWVLNVFNHTMTEKLPPLRKDTDHQIKLEELNEKKKSILNPLYNMTREKLLVLQKTLTELLNKQFIQVNHLLQHLFYSYRSQKMNFSSVWTTVTWTESLKESLSSFINIWDSAEHWTGSMIH
jgi:hypothetical protein